MTNTTRRAAGVAAVVTFLGSTPSTATTESRVFGQRSLMAPDARVRGAAVHALLVQVDNDARIPATDPAETEQLVARSYLPIGVQVIWEYGEVALDDPRGLRVHLRLLSRTNADRKITQERIGRAVLGQTNRPARLVYIFAHRIVEASVKYAHSYTHILGLVVSHELGHVLLPPGSHSDSGMMNGRTNLWGKIEKAFTPEEGEAIRAALLER